MRDCVYVTCKCAVLSWSAVLLADLQVGVSDISSVVVRNFGSGA